MKIHPDHIGVQSIHGYGPGWVQVGAEKIFHSVIITPAGDRIDWGCQHFEQLSAVHFERLTHFAAELVIFGSGSAPALCRPGTEPGADRATDRTGNHGHPGRLPHLQHFGRRGPTSRRCPADAVKYQRLQSRAQQRLNEDSVRDLKDRRILSHEIEKYGDCCQ
jgi:hypothetical protein